MSKKTIEVNPENFQTNKKGIFAAGNLYLSRKIKIDFIWFHEVTLMMNVLKELSK